MTAPADDLPPLPPPTRLGIWDIDKPIKGHDDDTLQAYARLAVQQDRERRQETPSEQDRMSLWTDIDHYASVALGPDKAAFLAARDQLAQAIDRLVPAGGRQEAPAEPTEDMLIAGQEAWMRMRKARPAMEDCEEARAVWSAMVTAAPAAAPGAADEARDAALLREAMARLLAWGGIGSQNWSTVVAFGVIDWAKSGATGPLPELPDYAEADVAAMRAAIAAHQPKAGT